MQNEHDKNLVVPQNAIFVYPSKDNAINESGIDLASDRAKIHTDTRKAQHSPYSEGYRKYVFGNRIDAGGFSANAEPIIYLEDPAKYGLPIFTVLIDVGTGAEPEIVSYPNNPILESGAFAIDSVVAAGADGVYTLTWEPPNSENIKLMLDSPNTDEISGNLDGQYHARLSNIILSSGTGVIPNVALRVETVEDIGGITYILHIITQEGGVEVAPDAGVQLLVDFLFYRWHPARTP